MKPITGRERDELFANFEREALHLEMRDVYAIKEEEGRLTKFLQTGYRDHATEAEGRRSWTSLIRSGTQAGKTFKRARIVSEPVTDYTRYVWAGTDPVVEAGEEVRWLPRRDASGIA